MAWPQDGQAASYRQWKEKSTLFNTRFSFFQKCRNKFLKVVEPRATGEECFAFL